MLIRWESDSRYYVVHIQRDLFGALTLRRIWGSLDSHRGGHKTELVEGDNDLETLRHVAQRIKAIAASRLRHGYRQVAVVPTVVPAAAT